MSKCSCGNFMISGQCIIDYEPKCVQCYDFSVLSIKNTGSELMTDIEIRIFSLEKKEIKYET